MATCAACMRPILGRDKFLLAGTEAFHRECVAHVETSIGNQNKAELARLRGELAEQRAQVRAVAELERRIRGLTRTLESRDRDLARATSARHELDAARETMQRERDNALREVALLQALAGARTDPPVAAPTPTLPVPVLPATPDGPPAESDLDDSEQRFRLLELDPLK